MNILIPDSWLREYLVTKATPAQIKEYVSLCGPSIERMHTQGKEVVYDIEITTNRVDSYSVYGVAREAAAILPRFGVKATLRPAPTKAIPNVTTPLGIHIQDSQGFCRRLLGIKIANITFGPSPAWMKKQLELVGQRPLSNIVDITNYVMWELGHPLHAFDYDRLVEKKIIIREAKKRETVITLDGKKHVMIGGELVFDDGTGTIIDVPGVMGTANTIVTEKTKNVLLFIENSDPAKIRFTSMAHAIRTQAAVINEKDPDSELGLIAINRAIALACELTGGRVASRLFDQYPKPYKPYAVSAARTKTDTYIGTSLPDKEVRSILTPLGFATNITKEKITVTPPSWRRDVTIDVDIIEEIARIFGYHNIKTKLPDTEPPVVIPDPQLAYEHDIKIRLRDWGYTETYTYSMISEVLMDVFALPKQEMYTITNPLSAEWVYMRSSLVPSMLTAIEQNLHFRDTLSLFEISMVYEWQPGNIPHEKPIFIVAVTGAKFRELKGIAQAIFSLFGIELPQEGRGSHKPWYNPTRSLTLGAFGTVGEINDQTLTAMKIKTPVTILELDFEALVAQAKSSKIYTPIPKYPTLVEDLAFVVPPGVTVASMIETLRGAHTLIRSIALLDAYKNTRTLRITYLDTSRTLTSEDVLPIREKLIALAQEKFSATLKTT